MRLKYIGYNIIYNAKIIAQTGNTHTDEEPRDSRESFLKDVIKFRLHQTLNKLRACSDNHTTEGGQTALSHTGERLAAD